MQERDKQDANNKYITFVCSENFVDMLDDVHWQLKKSKSELIRDSVEFYINSNLQDGDLEKVSK